MPSPTDLAGCHFGMLTAVYPVTAPGQRRRWFCRCSCGGTTIVLTEYLTNGDTKSCGCQKMAGLERARRKHGDATKHARTAEYKIWCSMKDRCNNPKNKAFALYGGRGIKVAPEWAESFPTFLAELGRRPSAAHTLDRIDNNLGYQPGNCRWATWSQQALNRRPYAHKPRVVLNGRALRDIADERGLRRETLFSRYHAGFRGDDLFVDGRTSAGRRIRKNRVMERQ